MIDDASPYRIGLMLSGSAHIVLLTLLLAGLGLGSGPLEDPKIYSVTVEGGKQLGGIQQVPKDDKKEPVAPAKNVSAVEPEKVKQEKQPEDTQVREPEKPVEDAEVSLAEQEKQKQEDLKRKEEEEKKLKEEEKKKLEKQKADKKKADEEKAAKEKAEKEKRQKIEAAEVNKRLEAALQRYKGESANAGGQNFGAAARGGSGMGGGVVLPAEVLAYIERVKAAVKNKWLWSDSQSPLRAAVLFKLDLDGRVTDLSISSSSGNSQYDESLRRAIMNANPLPPPPAAYYEQYLKNPRMFFDSSESR